MLELIAIKTDSGSGSGSAAGPAYAYPLDLYPNTELNIVWENPLFLTDRIPAAFSLSFDLPATPNNLKVFNYPNRVPVLGVYTSVNALIRHQGQYLSKARLYDTLYGFEDADVGVNAIELYIARLRKKFTGSDVAITTQRGIGYRIGLNG